RRRQHVDHLLRYVVPAAPGRVHQQRQRDLRLPAHRPRPLSKASANKASPSALPPAAPPPPTAAAQPLEDASQASPMPLWSLSICREFETKGQLSMPLGTPSWS